MSSLAAVYKRDRIRYIQGHSIQPATIMTQSEQFEQQPLSAHLAELRSCLLISLAAVVLCFVVCYAVVRDLADWFLQPLVSVLPEGSTLIFTSYQAGFFFI